MGQFESLPEESFFGALSCVINDIIMRETVVRDRYRDARRSVPIRKMSTRM
jgi:hypothetical protein